MLSTTTKDQTKVITDLLNGTFSSLETVVPIKHTRAKPQLLEKNFHIGYGVLIGMTGDIKGKLVLSGESTVFSKIGETMYGMPLEGDMLLSFSGELGNMIAGGLSTTIVENGININITAPTMMQGNTTLSGFKQGLRVTTSFDHTGKLDIMLLLD
ncbi:MAG TPA: chemotaxis protein CheX [Lentibacillus sp.]|uniref:chemotaxis protein CheX n=1 Tax=Lentibacillus sp. TaxID=1925746 RepID=UPI002B4B0DBF|nr:chemotaxis protein CheX [Lentibacillus sp.]HLR63380.1 chemotaxis protein CheX [Lentibacillus sp.]